MGTEHYFGAGGNTNIHAGTLMVLVLSGVLVWVLPRRYAFIPLLSASLFMPPGQQVVVGGLHFTLSRMLLVCGWLRLVSVRIRESRPGMRWARLDTVFLSYCLANAAMFSLRWGEIEALINRFGFLYNALGMYFFVRYFVRSEEDLDRATRTFAWIMVVVAVFMLTEQITGRNAFSVFGGVPEFTAVRDGRLRAQGPFVHPLTAGAAGAVLFPLFFGLGWQRRRNRVTATFGCIASVAVAACSMSSTSIVTLVGGCFALCMWPLRSHLAWFQRGAVAVLFSLHLVMKAPVWALISRIDLTGSSSSYHRFLLVDQFIRRFGEWWLAGTDNTFNWGWDMWDTINTYVAQGTDGGLLTFLLFIAVISVAFRHLGMAWKTCASQREQAVRFWALGSMLFAHTVAFWGIGYFDQSALAWYAELAMIATALSLRRVMQQPAITSAKVAPYDARGLQLAHSADSI